jgi:N-acetylmuramoyl-L-alanine amidase
MPPSRRVRLGTFVGLLSGAWLLGHPGVATAKSLPHRTAAAPARTHKLTETGAVGRHRALTARQTPVQHLQGRSQVAMTHVYARSKSPSQPAPSHSTPSQDPADLPLIVIDPGHGGRDPGAIGASGTPEKAITLAVALELRSRLDATGRYRTRLTRSRDRSISLADRLAFARQNHADLIIAIHADASPDRHARGASVYVGSGQGTEQFAVAGSGASASIAHALADQNPPPEASSARLQYSMIEQLSDDVRMVASPARSAHLYVLASRRTPSVLVETGFISNRQDEALLKQPAHRNRLVSAITDAVDDYFRGLGSSASRT